MLILIASGPQAGAVVQFLGSGPLYLGREGPFQLTDTHVSRQHACLRGGQGHWSIEDLCSCNGTYLNGRIVEGLTRIHSGDVIQMGATAMVLRDLEEMHDMSRLLPSPGMGQLQITAVPARRQQLPATEGPAPSVAQDRRSPLLWRWLPILAAAVMLLAIAAQAVLYLRSRDAIDDMRAEARRDNDHIDGLVGTLRHDIRAHAESDRVALMQEMATVVNDRSEESVRSLDEKIRARLEEHLASSNRRLMEQIRPALEAQAAAQAASTAAATRSAIAAAQKAAAPPAPPPASSAAPMLSHPDFVILIDAASELSAELPPVQAEISRELSRLDRPAKGRILLLSGGHRWEFSSDLLAAPREVPASWNQFLNHLRPGEAVDHGASTLRDTLKHAINLDPRQLFILATTLAEAGDSGPQAARQLLLHLNGDRAVQIHIIHFFARDAAEGLKSIARDHRGTYSFIPRLTPEIPAN